MLTTSNSPSVFSASLINTRGDLSIAEDKDLIITIRLLTRARENTYTTNVTTITMVITATTKFRLFLFESLVTYRTDTHVSNKNIYNACFVGLTELEFLCR